jgi:hypothetical protein
VITTITIIAGVMFVVGAAALLDYATDRRQIHEPKALKLLEASTEPDADLEFMRSKTRALVIEQQRPTHPSSRVEWIESWERFKRRFN